MRDKLVAALGLLFDPFREVVSESEHDRSVVYDQSSEEVSKSKYEQTFSYYFVDLKPSLLDNLLDEGHTILFGDYGMGKSATRIALEYLLRRKNGREPTLCVTYRPNVQDFATKPPAQRTTDHLDKIADAAVIDGVVQFLERLDDEQREVSDKQILALRLLCGALPKRLRQSLREVATDKPGSGEIATDKPGSDRERDATAWARREVATDKPGSGRERDASSWASSYRTKMRPVERSPQWRETVRMALEKLPPYQILLKWEDARAALETLGFARIFLLVDAVDEGKHTAPDIAQVLDPLIERLTIFEYEDVSVKAFVPRLPGLEEYYRRLQSTLTSSVHLDTIDPATPSQLQAIIHERLRVASASHDSLPSLDAMAGSDLDESIEGKLAALAKGSPRTMLDRVSRLLDFHAEHGFIDNARRGRTWITGAEWRQFLRSIEQRA